MSDLIKMNLYELINNESIFQILADSIKLGVAIKNDKLEFIYANKAFCELLGKDGNNLMGKDDGYILPKEMAKQSRIREQDILATGKKSQLMENIPISDGQVRSFEISRIPISNDEGNIIGILIILGDSNGKHLIEEGLKKNEERYRALIEHSWDVFELIDPDGNILYISPAAARISGYQMDELVGRNVFEAMAPEYQKYAEELINELLQKPEQTFSMNLKQKHKDGQWRWIEGSCTNLLNDPNIHAIVVNYHDITDRKQAIEALSESEEKYRLLVENINEGILIISQDNFVKFANPKMIDISGYSWEEIMGVRIDDIIYPEDKDEVNKAQESMLEENISDSMVLRIIVKDGSTKWIEASGIVISWEGDHAFLIFINDITEKRKMEEELLRMQKLESIGTLAGGIAHDFNNTLTGILGNISLAKMLIDQKEKASERLVEAESATYRAKELTSQLLTFSRGGSPILKTVSIADTLKESVSFALSGSKSTYGFRLAKDLWPVVIDEFQISQVINNIVINADQAMPQGGLVVIRAENMNIEQNSSIPIAPGLYVKVSFEDNGGGISQEHLSRIFDPYFSTKQKGSGLGLAISYSIVKKHKGHIGVESIIGKKTVFHLYLPASCDKIDYGEDDGDISQSQEAKRILVMDDVEVIRDLLSQILSQIGYDVVVASDGSEALELYMNAISSEEPFDVVIMDLTVPGGMGGIDAIGKIRETNPNIKAIVSSGYYDHPVMSNFKEYGFDAVIAKPYRPKELYEVLREVLAK